MLLLSGQLQSLDFAVSSFPLFIVYHISTILIKSILFHLFQRECEEEMGIPLDTEMEHLFTFLYQDDVVRCWGDAWDVVYDGPLKLQETEVETVEKMSMQVSLSLRLKGLLMYTVGALFHVEWCISQLLCPSITLYSINSIAYYHYTDIYPLLNINYKINHI